MENYLEEVGKLFLLTTTVASPILLITVFYNWEMAVNVLILVFCCCLWVPLIGRFLMTINIL